MAVIYSYNAEDAAPKAASRPAAMVPLLVILFVVSYAILTMLVFEQGQTIESQRGLIRDMLKDSTQLAALKDKVARDDGRRIQNKAAAPAEHKSADASNSAAGAKTPDAKGLDKETKRTDKPAHSTKEIPGKPAEDLDDVRRLTKVI